MPEHEKKFIVLCDNMKIYSRMATSTIVSYESINNMGIVSNTPQRICGYIKGISTPFSDLGNHVGIPSPFSDLGNHVGIPSHFHAHSVSVSDMLSIVPDRRSVCSHENIPIDKPKTSLDMFMERLENQDRNLLKESLNSIRSLPFVTNIKFEELDSPTIIIVLSKMDEDTEDKIYQTEYDLLKLSKNNIDFLVLSD
jgi:hypothetical protein